MHTSAGHAQKGFTLIELIITIVIIGVLAAVAIPRFVNLTDDAEKGVAAGVAASLASATSVNYGRSKLPGAVACTAVNTPAGCSFWTITDCTTLGTAAPNLADFPTGYTVAGTATLVNTGVSTPGCVVQNATATISVTFNAYGAT
jgi:MSHA pilin protein MshA